MGASDGVETSTLTVVGCGGAGEFFCALAIEQHAMDISTEAVNASAGLFM
jgi:hypothetical protein